MAVAVVAVVLAGAGIAIGLAAADDSGPSGSKSSAVGSDTTSPSASASGSPTAPPSPARKVAAPRPRPTKRPPTLAVTVTGAASYVEVRLPNRTPLVANTYGHGKRFVFTQPSLYVVIGDAGAVRLDVNGVTKAPAGKPGQVLRFWANARR